VDREGHPDGLAKMFGYDEKRFSYDDA
jgi:hypothetical protein